MKNNSIAIENKSLEKKKPSKLAIVITVLCVLIAASTVLYLISWVFKLTAPITNPKIYWRLMQPRLFKLLAMVIAGVLLSVVSLVFQTMTQNRILTPSMIGIDSTFTTTQTLIILIAGTTSIFITNAYLNFVLCAVIMLTLSLILFGAMLRGHRNNIMLMLLAGMVVSQMLGSINSFLSIMMNPDDFTAVYYTTRASLNNMNTDLVYFTLPILALVLFLFVRERHTYDIMSLGEDQAISLGVNYTRAINRNLVYIAIAMAISTALIGPLSFLGLISVNAAREIYKRVNHKTLIILCSLIGVLTIVLGQAIVDILSNAIMLTTIINLAGGTYVVILVLKQNKI